MFLGTVQTWPWCCSLFLSTGAEIPAESVLVSGMTALLLCCWPEDKLRRSTSCPSLVSWTGFTSSGFSSHLSVPQQPSLLWLPQPFVFPAHPVKWPRLRGGRWTWVSLESCLNPLKRVDEECGIAAQGERELTLF